MMQWVTNNAEDQQPTGARSLRVENRRARGRVPTRCDRCLNFLSRILPTDNKARLVIRRNSRRINVVEPCRRSAIDEQLAK
jgi:hypothetical protein